jgi:oligopeptide/dipeptide ABC transporter ATP-binding protein
VARGTLIPIVGQPPHPGALAGGCAFAPRCTRVTDACSVTEPDLVVAASNDQVQAACINLVKSEV